MKYISVLALLWLNAKAQDDSDSGDLGRKYPQVKSMLAELMNISANEAKQKVRNYGCFCYIDGKRVTGSTNKHARSPVDELDSACKQLARAKRCIDIDVNNDLHNRRCNIGSQYRWFMDNGDIVCGDQNDPDYFGRNSCRMHLCALEKDFVHKIKSLYDGGYTQNPNYSKMDDNDYDTVCLENNAGSSGSSVDWNCCGDGANRKTYNSVVNSCCNDGSVKTTGLC